MDKEIRNWMNNVVYGQTIRYWNEILVILEIKQKGLLVQHLGYFDGHRYHLKYN